MNEVEEVGAQCSCGGLGLLDAARIRHGGLGDCAVVDCHIHHVSDHHACSLRVRGRSGEFCQ